MGKSSKHFTEAHLKQNSTEGWEMRGNWKGSRLPQKLTAMSRGAQGQSSKAETHRLNRERLGRHPVFCLSQWGRVSVKPRAHQLASLASLLWWSVLHLCLPRQEVWAGHLSHPASTWVLGSKLWVIYTAFSGLRKKKHHPDTKPQKNVNKVLTCFLERAHMHLRQAYEVSPSAHCQHSWSPKFKRGSRGGTAAQWQHLGMHEVS